MGSVTKKLTSAKPAAMPTTPKALPAKAPPARNARSAIAQR
jgi:hypothetical protein